ncbi:Yip1 family protein [Sphingobium aquiterrae]|uniref:Yip1 family protein n=1 Tax=Sphingobium aquiterrae TaxID=2038656 RepID=UPI003017DBC9
MTEGDPISTPSSILERAKAIIMTPKSEWAKIDGEPASIGGIFTGYAMILAAIPALSGLIGGQVFGYGMMGISWRPSLMGAISMAVVQYVLSLVGLFVLAFIIDALAPTFGGQKDRLKAFKVAAYSATAGWLAGIFSLIPSLSMLGILGLYSLYLLYTGLPLLMKAPQEKAVGYTVVTIIAAVVLSLLAAAIAAPVGGMFAGGMMGGSPEISGNLKVPGVGTVDMGKLNDASRQMEVAAKRMEASANGAPAAAVNPAALQAMLPARIGGYARTETESASMSAGAHASARYEAGDNRSFRLEVTDMAAMGALGGLAAALNVQSSKQTATGYEKTQTIGGRMVSEEWDNEAKDGKYATTVANRFMVEANGNTNGVDELKAAVAAVGLDKLEAMAK